MKRRILIVWKILLPLLFVLCGISCKPDNENELRGRIGTILEEGKTWYMYGPQPFYSSGDTDTVWYFCKCQAEKDTVLQGESWNLVEVAYTRIYGGDSEISSYEVFRNQDGVSVYGYGLGGGKDKLFVFDVQEGDMLVLGEVQVDVREVFDTVLPGGDGKQRRALRAGTDVWVEDIGSLTYGILQSFSRDGEPQWQLIGCEKDGEWYYKHPSFDAFMELVQDTTGRH